MSLFSWRHQIEHKQTPRDEPPAETEPEDVPADPAAANLPTTLEVPPQSAPSMLEEPPPKAAEHVLFTPANVPGEAYTTSGEHLTDELQRIDQFIRAQTVRWKRTIAAGKPEKLWGMVHVTEAEVDAYLNSPFRSEHDLPPDLERELSHYWQEADRLAKRIESRRGRLRDVTLRLDRLQALFKLDRLERDILLVLLLPEVDSRYRRLYGYLQDDASRICPTVELILQILHPEAPTLNFGWAAFEPRSHLLTPQLIMVGGGVDGDQPLPSRFVRIDERIAGFLLGSQMPDSRLDGTLQIAPALAWTDIVVGDEQLERLKAVSAWWQLQRSQDQGGSEQKGGTLFLHGPYGSGRLRAAQVLTGATLPPTLLYVADTAAALRSPHGFERLVRLAYREALLQDAALYWAHVESLLPLDSDPATEAQLQPRWETLVAAAEEFPVLSLLASNTPWEPANHFRTRTFMRIAFQIPDYALRKILWEKYLPPSGKFLEPNFERTLLCDLLASAFQLTEGQIEDAVSTAHQIGTARAPNDRRLTAADLFEGCRRQSARRLITFARRIEPEPGLDFEDLILPAPNRRQLDELRQRIELQGKVLAELGSEKHLPLGKGLIVLFTGASGTGKTLAAQILANKQNVDLYKVDLSAIVSKWVGETEKNLSVVFAQAEGSNGIIFFDECDALFAKRGEVKEARDRWANAEANYLLQRIEEYSGIVILATNLSQNIDEAFLRRIQVVVEFPLPDVKARERIWLRMFPEGVGRPADADIHELADRFDLSGGNIRNIVMDALFRAVADQGENPKLTITVRHLVLSAAREYQKLGRPLNTGAFGADYFKFIVTEKFVHTPPMN
jgi:ATPase family associated with various cellular activities (AAA)